MMIKALGIVIVGGALCYLLSEMGSRMTKPIGALFAVLALIYAVSAFSDVGRELAALMERAGISEVGEDAMKILGTGYIFGASADTLDTLGESGASRSLDLLCRVEIMLIALPYIKEIIAMGLSLIK
ncbi:MAG: hypothetical protein IJW66_00945 [Clostridia bacterium]|nr:hypothetical protein [Clostridia bacterium]